MQTQTQIAISLEVLEAIKKLPQIGNNPNATPFNNDLWQPDYFIDQVLRNLLNLDADYNMGDLELILKRKIIV